MEPSCVRQNLIPGTSKLFSDYVYNFDRVEGFFPYPSWEAEHVVESAKTLAFPAERRALLVEALRKQNGESASLEKLAQAGTVAVVTGQQVGFLSGPAYTVFKALSAVKLAAHLNEQGVPAVPIFWLATEDHDLAEVDHAWVFNQDATPARISLGPSVVNGGPVGSVELSDLPIEQLRAALGELPYADEVVERVEAAYHPGSTLGGAFRHLAEEILSGLGLLFLDPLAPEIRQLAAPFLCEVAGRVPELVAALKCRDAELAKAGYHSQVHLEDDSSLLFLLRDGRRAPVRREENQFAVRDQLYSAADLQGLASALSPNALLRPVMQDYLLPTVSYVAGPAEIAYMAQGSVLYQALLGRMPVIYPRNGFTLLDGRAAKLLGRYGLRVPDLLEFREEVQQRIAEKLVPQDLAAFFKSFEKELNQRLAGLRAKLEAFDPTLAAAAHKSASKITYQIEKLSRKTARETLQRDERAARDAAYLIDLIYPHRHLQERFYSILPFLAKHGLDLPQRLLEYVQLACPDHMVRIV
jgi:bacillithiol biosynthesis cysteine-adding enzyme BshC